MDNTARIIDLLNLPLLHRCAELGLLFDRCNLKELQDLFPRLVDSIFNVGGYGWGLRLMTKNTAPLEFDVLYNFFIPSGPMFRLCYRLLNDTLKYEVPITSLPIKMKEMIESGRYSSFYTDVINIDPFRRQIVSLSLNSFDYYLLHFAIHGTVPLHKSYPAAMTINTEKWKSPYFFLTADYLCCFLPSHPDAVVMPQNICKTVKSMPTSPTIPQIQPTRTPKYIKLSALHHTQSPTAGVSPASRASLESWKVDCWRSESVLYIFIDNWLRYDCEDNHFLPSTEFIRVVRILVKQLHAFGNMVDSDHTPMAVLRQIAQPIMNARIYPFLKSIISRWPLDSSFSDVLELWLSYLQPWRYTYNRNLSAIETMVPLRYENFVMENLIVYTQIYVKLIPRFERLDLSTLRNIHMLYRVLKVFSQHPLAELLRKSEMMVRANNTTLNLSSSTAMHHSSSFDVFNRSGSNSRPGSSCGGHATDTSINLDDSYLFLFGDRIMEIASIIRKVHMTRLSTEKNLLVLERQKKQQTRGFWNFIRSLFNYDEQTVQEEVLQEKRKVLEFLNTCVQWSANIFEINLADLNLPDSSEYVEDSDVESFDNTMNMTLQSELSDQSIIFSPAVMKSRSRNLTYKGDTALLPIMSRENVFLVRFLHQVSCKLNQMFSDEMDELWSRRTFVGRLARQILRPPTVIQNFDNSRGIKMLRTENLGPRICLRVLASYKSLTIICFAFLFGYLFLGAPSYGLLLLLLLFSVALLINSCFHDLPVVA